MRIIARLIPVALLGSLSACATIFTGTSQRIVLDTNPQGASCDVQQGGIMVAHVPRTPDMVDVSKSSAAIEVTCSKPGYHTQRLTEISGANGWVFGNLVIGGLVGVVIDFGSGAAYRYQPSMAMDLDREPGSLRSGYPVAAAGSPAFAGASPQDSLDFNDSTRFTAATGRYLPSQHGLIRLPPTTQGGDYTYIWPTTRVD